jgi:hypothetical protein
MSPKTIIVDVMFHFVHNITKIVLIKNLEIIQKKKRQKKKKNLKKIDFFFLKHGHVFLSFCVQNVATIEKLERHYKLLGS